MAGLELAVSTVARPNPLVIAWRWRYEIGLGVLVALAVIGLNFAVGLWWGLATIVTASCLTAAWPAARKHVVIRAWCVITPHRVRTGCAQAWIHSRRGKIPVVLCTTAEPFGERVYLWCRAGVASEDLVAARPLLAAACWAETVYVARHDRFAHLVVLDVIRLLVAFPAEDERPDVTEPPSWPDADILHHDLVTGQVSQGRSLAPAPQAGQRRAARARASARRPR